MRVTTKDEEGPQTSHFTLQISVDRPTKSELGISDFQLQTQFWHVAIFCCVFNNYSPRAKLILLNNPRDEVEGIIQQY